MARKDDPNDKKPEDWVENSKISDPEAVKVRRNCLWLPSLRGQHTVQPEDWDEDQPLEVRSIHLVLHLAS